MAKNLYRPEQDKQFTKPYIDKEEHSEKGYLYIHGGFEGTMLKFSFFFPKKENYQGRFFQYLPPVQGSEDAALEKSGIEDRIDFAIKHGGYFVESNMGVVPFAPLSDPTIIYRSSACVAEYSREVAKRLYGDHRPYGYVYGGSGGSFKTFACIENTEVWDGAAPYVIGTPYSIPNSFTIRTHAKRVLRRAFPYIKDFVEPCGITKEQLYEKLNDEEREVLEEVTRFGFPMYDWFMYDKLDDGSLPIFIMMLKGFDPEYYVDFWEKPGYLGYDKTNSVNRDRIKFTAEVKAISVPGIKNEDVSGLTGVDEAWKRSKVSLDGKAYILTDKSFEKYDYLDGVYVTVKSGAAACYKMVMQTAENNVAILEPFFGATDFTEKLSLVKAGDTVEFDNSDYLALQSYHRHQVPPIGECANWNVYRNEDGTPKYPQREKQYGPQVAYGGCGNLQSGEFGKCKVISIVALMDESSLTWPTDWYRQKLKKARGDDKPYYRVWYIDKSLHGELSPDETHLVSYHGALFEALLSVVEWVEKGIEPCQSSVYSLNEGVITVPETARNRCGVQPVVTLKANGRKRAEVKKGEKVSFTAEYDLPVNAGKVIKVEWCFDGVHFIDSKSFDESSASAEYTYDKSGEHFAVVRVIANRRGNDFYTNIYNIDRARVVVK